MNDKLKQLPVAKATLDEIREARANVAITNPDHLKKWLLATRPFLVFESKDMMEALEPLWPGGAEALQNVVNCYRAHRYSIPSGDTRVVETLGQQVEQTVFKDDALTHTEKDRCVRWLVSQLLDEDPNWKLENPAL